MISYINFKFHIEKKNVKSNLLNFSDRSFSIIEYKYMA